MKVAITGATGFIGTLLAQRHLQMGNQVHILTRRPADKLGLTGVTSHFGDLSNPEALRQLVDGADILYHCAAEIRDTHSMRAVNVDGTRHLIEQARGRIKHWVQLSSVGVYGPVFSGRVTEERAYHPANEYEKTKLESDQLVIEAGQSGAFSYTIIRPSNVIGPGMRNASLFALMRSVARGVYFYIGPKGASANYVSARNVVEALCLAGTHPKAKNEIYNLSDWCAIEEFIGQIATSLGKPQPRLRFPKPLMLAAARVLSVVPRNPLTASRVRALTSRAVYPNDKIENELGYQNSHPVRDAIRELTDFYKTTHV